MICDITNILEASPSQILTIRSTVWKCEDSSSNTLRVDYLFFIIIIFLQNIHQRLFCMSVDGIFKCYFNY